MRITFDCPDGWEPKIKQKATERGLISPGGIANTSLVCRQALSLFLFSELSLDKYNKKNVPRKKDCGKYTN